MNIKKLLEDNIHIFIINIKKQAANTKEAADVIEKYMDKGEITPEEEKILKTQLVDSLKIVGVVIPFIVIPGSAILMPILIKVAEKHNIELMPTSFQGEKKKVEDKIEVEKKPKKSLFWWKNKNNKV